MEQNQNEIFDLLGLEPAPLSVTGVEISAWGRQVIINCEYRGTQAFQLLFEDCHSIEWDVHGEQLEEEDTPADAMGIFLGEAEHHASAIIYTEYFELAVLYGRFTMLKA